MEAVKDNEEKLSQLNIQISVMNYMEHYVNGKVPTSGSIPSLLGVSDPTLIQLLGILNEAELQYVRLKKVSEDRSDAIGQVRDEIIRLKPAIIENLHNIRTNLLTS